MTERRNVWVETPTLLLSPVRFAHPRLKDRKGVQLTLIVQIPGCAVALVSSCFCPGFPQRPYRCVVTDILSPVVDNSRFLYYVECFFFVNQGEASPSITGVTIELTREA